MFEKKNIFERNDKPVKGKILLAEPFMCDPTFKRSVVLLCNNTKEGALGFILNKKLDLKFSDALPEFSYMDNPVYYGGPVEPDTLHYLHLMGDVLPNSEEITDGVYWGGSFEVLKKLLSEKKVNPEKIRFFLGYSGWDAEQMGMELKEKSWIVTTAQCSDIFNHDGNKLWASILKDMGGDYKSIASYPENPTWN